jgi:hypothetical protein
MRIRGSKPRFGSADKPENLFENTAWEFIGTLFTRRFRPGLSTTGSGFRKLGVSSERGR